jgi:four helix bundle protein
MLSYQNLEAWKKGMEIVKEVYIIGKAIPSEEIYALTSQMKRAAVFVPSNIAEGIGRNYKKDTIQILHIARGSLYELETLLNVAKMVNYMKEENAMISCIKLIEDEKKILNGLIKSFEQRTDLK